MDGGKMPAALVKPGAQKLVWELGGSGLGTSLEWEQPLASGMLECPRVARSRILVRERSALDELARARLLENAQFQGHARRAETIFNVWNDNSELRILLNPIRTWTRFQSGALPPGREETPLAVLCYFSRGEIRAAFLELEGQALTNELADFQPCTFRQWAAASNFGRPEQMVKFTQDLARIGLVAWA
jgi:hypothetical protein